MTLVEVFAVAVLAAAGGALAVLALRRPREAAGGEVATLVQA
jgi:hypothetical protein